MTDALAWAAEFATGAPPVSAERFGSGHVNDTFLVTTGDGGRKVLQRIGRQAFDHPEQVMANVVLVTGAMASLVPDPRHRLTLVPTKDGAWWVTSADGDCWRMYDHIAGSMELARPITPAEFAAVGKAFGDFLVQVADLPADDLYTTIPGFHDEPRYVERLKAVVAADPCGRVDAVRLDIERVLAYEAVSHDLDSAGLPLRVTHNDAKVANVLFDAATRQPLCVVDLDTVQPGYCVNDFGDIVRSGAATAPEDEKDLSLVGFSPQLFEACLEGYMAACGDILTPAEVSHLRHGARLMTLETSLRFLTDHIAGDIFYRIDYPGQNLDRARNQACLLADMDRHWQWMGRAVDTLVG